MDFTKLPEVWVLVLALTLDLEDLGEVGLLRDALNHVLEELRLGKRVLVVHGEVVEKLVFSRVRFLVLESTEAAHKVVPSVEGLMVDTFVTVSQLLEETHGQLRATVVSTSENSSNHGVAHPRLSHHSVACLHLTDDW